MDRRFWKGMARDWGAALLIGAAVVIAWNLLTPGPPSSGDAPDFTLTDLDGNAYTLSELRGEVVVLNFWATWCGPCRTEIPELARFQDAHPDVKVLGISVDERLTPQGIEAVAKRLGINYVVLHDPDGNASDPYRVSTLPTTFVVDAHGDIGYTHIGTISERRLRELVGRYMPEAMP